MAKNMGFEITLHGITNNQNKMATDIYHLLLLVFICISCFITI